MRVLCEEGCVGNFWNCPGSSILVEDIRAQTSRRRSVYRYNGTRTCTSIVTIEDTNTGIQVQPPSKIPLNTSILKIRLHLLLMTVTMQSEKMIALHIGSILQTADQANRLWRADGRWQTSKSKILTTSVIKQPLTNEKLDKNIHCRVQLTVQAPLTEYDLRLCEPYR